MAEANEDDGKVSNSEAAVDPYPGNADETLEANEDDGKVSNSENADETVEIEKGNSDEQDVNKGNPKSN